MPSRRPGSEVTKSSTPIIWSGPGPLPRARRRNGPGEVGCRGAPLARLPQLHPGGEGRGALGQEMQPAAWADGLRQLPNSAAHCWCAADYGPPCAGRGSGERDGRPDRGTPPPGDASRLSQRRWHRPSATRVTPASVRQSDGATRSVDGLFPALTRSSPPRPAGAVLWRCLHDLVILDDGSVVLETPDALPHTSSVELPTATGAGWLFDAVCWGPLVARPSLLGPPAIPAPR